MTDTEGFDTAARLSVLQSVLAHLMAAIAAPLPNGAADLASIQSCVLKSLADPWYGSAMPEDAKEELQVHIRTVSANLFRTAEGLRQQMAASLAPDEH